MIRYECFVGKRRESITTNAILLYSCDHEGKRYVFTVSAEQQANCPKWDTKKNPNPPLSAADAIARAGDFITTIETRDGLFWEFEELALVKIEDAWLWQARYGLSSKGIMAGVQPWMPCWILMDGTVIQPRVMKGAA